MNSTVEAMVTIALAIVVVAVVATLVSKQANTSGVIQSFGSAFSNALGVATSPVTGASTTYDLSYPGSSGSTGS